MKDPANRTTDSQPEWRRYERLVALLCSEEFSSDDTTVIPNARIVGRLSGVQRQVDVLIDRRFDCDRSRRVIVDAKKHRRRLDVKDVEEFEGMMRDCGAHTGILVCPNGYTKAAKRRAQSAIDTRLVTLDELEKFSLNHWDDCYHSQCSSASHGLVLWDSPFAIQTAEGLISIFCVGKCDQCRRFHVWCWDCAQRFALDDEDEYKCGCQSDWFWLTAIEEDIDDYDTEPVKCVYLLLPSLRDVLIIDRKPLM